MLNTVPETIDSSAGSRKTVHVAVGVIVRGGRVLIARRPDTAHQGGLLEFPGGKVEPGETVQQALCREIAEETGLKLTEGSLQPVIGIYHDYGDKRVFLDVWSSHSAQGEPEGKEGQPVGWLAPELLKDSDFPAANRPIIRALRLPHRLAITGGINDAAEGLARLGEALDRGLNDSLVVFRAPALSRAVYLDFASAALGVCRERSVDPILHGPADLCQALPEARGVHLPWREAQRHSERPVSNDCWLGVSCHSAEQLRHAERLRADYVLLGNVLETPSHPGQPGIGWAAFQELVATAVVPVYGIGGLGPEHESRARAHGGQGVAGIGFWW